MRDNEFQLTNMSHHQQIFEENTDSALNLIRSLLQTSLESKAFSNKLHTKVLIFRYERKFEFNRTNLNDVSLLDYIFVINQHFNVTFIVLQYCINPPFVYIIPKPDYRSMLEDKKMIETITKNVALLYPVGIDLSLSEKYKYFYYFNMQYQSHNENTYRSIHTRI